MLQEDYSVVTAAIGTEILSVAGGGRWRRQKERRETGEGK
jgi:hypothetical protein